jgi:nucleoside-diphosphate-sugar epimerase
MILVTGASGMIGRALAEELCASTEVRAQVRNRGEFSASAPVLAKRLELREADFSGVSGADITRLVAGCSAIVHCAGLVHQPDAGSEAHELLNTTATRSLAAAAEAEGVRTFVFLSTIAVYGDGPLENAREDTPLQPATPYAMSKAACERQLLKSGLDRTIIFRPALVFGEGDRGNMIRLIRQIARGRYVNMTGRTVRKSVIYARDLARAIADSLLRAPSGRHIFNAAHPQPVTLEELARQISMLAGRGESLPRAPEWLVRAGVRTLETMLGGKAPVQSSQLDRLLTTTTINCDRLVAELGFQPRWTLADALKAEIDWARAARML